MIRLAVIGAGSHSRKRHLPALRDHCAGQPGTIELAALCDLDLERARAAAAEFGFARCCGSLEELLEEVRPQAVIAVTPHAATAAVALRVMAAGLPLLLEKPVGRTLAEAQGVAEMAAAARAPVMVSLNRRFDPAITAARAWLAGRKVAHARATLVRHGRGEAGFVVDAGLHALDTLHFLAGPLRGWRGRPLPRAGGESVVADLDFPDGATGVVELLPCGGHWRESYDLFGPDFHLTAEAGGSCRVWENGHPPSLLHAPAANAPAWVADGTAAETAAFLESVRGLRPPSPTPAETLPALACALGLAG